MTSGSTNKRYDVLLPGVPVLALACGTWWFIRGTVVGESATGTARS